MASQTATMTQPWVLDAYHDLVAASLITPTLTHHSMAHAHMPPPPPHHTASTAPLHPHHLMGSPLTSSIPLTSPIASPMSPALPIGSPMLTPMGSMGPTDPNTSLPAWGSWDTLVATTAAIPGATLPCHPEAFYYLDPAWFGKGEPETPNHVILMTIINPAYPITVDVIHTICQSYGNVLRIVIFKKNGVQCMVEYETVDSATRARDALQGADIYSGCCTLRVEYAKPAKLNVYRNDAESWDFTNSAMDQQKPQSAGSSRPPLLQEPRFGEQMHPSGGGLNGQMGGGPHRSSGLFNSPGGMPDRYGGGGGGAMDLESWDDRRGGRDRRYNRYSNNGMSNGSQRGGLATGGLAGAAPFMGGSGGPPNTMAGMGGPAPGLPQQGAVLMVYSLNKDRMNSDKLFNLLCLYGNVVRIKFLKTKEGCAMVQMGDALAVERAIGNLNNTNFFGNKMQLGYSKQAFLADVQQPYDLPDGTPSFKDYMGNKNNRFINPEQASKNRIQPPSKILHFFNTPPNISDSAMRDVFIEEDVTPPKAMKLFQSKTDRSSSGLLEFADMSESLEALVCCNHARIPNPISAPTDSRFPFVMKLCFSSSRTLQTKMDRSSAKSDDDDEDAKME